MKRASVEVVLALYVRVIVAAYLFKSSLFLSLRQQFGMISKQIDVLDAESIYNNITDRVRIQQDGKFLLSPRAERTGTERTVAAGCVVQQVTLS